ncbi:MAG TPA: ABC transporter permease [Trebonia sp.]|jgi:peptide/nickel transport system permease protein|nr:ABC transporter permease [Trebonia sp.]
MTIPVNKEAAAVALTAAGVSRVRASRARGRLRQSLSLYLPAGLLVLIIAACFLYPLVGNVSPPVGGSVLNAGLPAGTPGFPLGTDASGNDILSRLLYGGRVSLEVGAATQVIGMVVGGLIGMIAGYSRGILAAVLMRVLDVLIAFPSLVLALAIAEGLGPGELHVIWALSFYSVPAFARLARAATLRLRDQNFMLAASMSGTSRWRIVAFHLAPNLLPQQLTFALLGAGVAIIQEGALSFLSLGVPPPGASWGNMIASGMQTMSVRPSLVLLPCLALLITVAALNLTGDALRARWSAR